MKRRQSPIRTTLDGKLRVCSRLLVGARAMGDRERHVKLTGRPDRPQRSRLAGEGRVHLR